MSVFDDSYAVMKKIRLRSKEFKWKEVAMMEVEALQRVDNINITKYISCAYQP